MKYNANNMMRKAELCFYGAITLAFLSAGISLYNMTPRKIIEKPKYALANGYDIKIGVTPSNILMAIGTSDKSDSAKHPYGDFTTHGYIFAEDTDANGTIDTFTLNGNVESKLMKLASKEKLSSLEKNLLQEKK